MAIGDHLNSIDLLNIKIEFGTIYYKIILVYMYYFISIFPQNQNIYRIYPSDKKMNYIIQLWRCNNKKYNDGTKKNLLNINYYIFNCYSKINYISLLYNYNLINKTKRMKIIIDEKEFKNTKIEAKKWLIPYEQSIKIEDKAFYKTVNLSKIRDLKTKKYLKSGYISTLVRNRRKNKFFVKAPKFTCLIKIIKIIIYMNLLVHILTCNNINIFKMNFSSITLQIKGPGLKKFLYQDFNPKPQDIKINNIEQNIDNIANYSYDFNEINNTVTLIWNDTLYNCRNMFHL